MGMGTLTSHLARTRFSFLLGCKHQRRFGPVTLATHLNRAHANHAAPNEPHGGEARGDHTHADHSQRDNTHRNHSYRDDSHRNHTH